MKKLICLYMLLLVCASSGFAQNEFANFIRKINALKMVKLKRTKVELKDTVFYHIPEEAVQLYIALFDSLQCKLDNVTVQCHYKNQGMGAQPYLVVSENKLEKMFKGEEPSTHLNFFFTETL